MRRHVKFLIFLLPVFLFLFLEKGRADEKKPCTLFNATSGGLIFTPADAAAMFGGTWEDNKSNLAKGYCMYQMWESGRRGQKGITLQKWSSSTFQQDFERIKKGETSLRDYLGDMLNKKLVDGIGADAYLSWRNQNSRESFPFEDKRSMLRSIYIRKGENVVAVSCVNMDLPHNECGEEHYKQIAKISAGRMPLLKNE